MSYNNCKSTKIPGPISGNALNGICEKASILTEKVFDSCLRQETLSNYIVSLTSTVPPTVAYPLTFKCAVALSDETFVENLTVSSISNDVCNARVTCSIVLPVRVFFTDANGVSGEGIGNVVIPRDCIMNISAPSVMPYTIKVMCNATIPCGSYVANKDFSLNLCVTEILMVTMKVQLLVPSFGYTFIPQCQDYCEQICDSTFDLPLYPQECGIDPRCCN